MSETSQTTSETEPETDQPLTTVSGETSSVLSGAQIKALSRLPSREELLAQLLSVMQAPITGFARTLNEVPGKFVRTLAAVRDSRQDAA